MVLGSAGSVLVGGWSPASLAVGGLVLLSTLAMVTSGSADRGAGRRAGIEENRRRFLVALDAVRTEMARSRVEQRAAALWCHPDPRSLWAVPGTARMWERRPADPDFADARVAVGSRPLARALLRPPAPPLSTAATAVPDPVAVAALDRLCACATVADIPTVVTLRDIDVLEIAGPVADSRPLARALLAQLVVFHAPDMLAVAVVAGPERWDEWQWVKWLPHAQHATGSDAAGPRRLVAGSLAEVGRWFRDDRDGSPRAAGAAGGPHLVVVVDGGVVSPGDALADLPAGVTVVDLSAATAALATRRRTRLRIDGGRIYSVTSTGSNDLGVADRLSVVEAEALARALAGWRPAGSETVARAGRAARCDLLQLLGVGEAADLDAERVWRDRSRDDRLRVPIGVDDGDRPVHLDLKEAARGGMGPHGLVVGATGSGKSELLRTLVLGLVVTHPPTALNLVLVDFKGGATFNGLAELPHTAALITNLEGDLTLVDRMNDALGGEVHRRQQLLRAAGGYASVEEYEAARESGAPLEPLPSLLVVCDEFSELLTRRPDLAELFATIGRLGRSLGIHLLLASQRLEEGRLRGLDSHLSYRIGLRTFSAADSRAVLGVADAYELPPVPGAGYLKDGTRPIAGFTAAFVSGPLLSRPARTAAGRRVDPRPVPFRADPVGTDELPPARADPAGAAPSGDEAGAPTERRPTDSLLQVVAGRLRGSGTPAREIWLPPLAEPVTLDRLVALPPLPSLPASSPLSPPLSRTVTSGPRHGAARDLHIPIGIVDRPFERRRDPWVLDLGGPSGHAAIVGAPQSGKSTVLRDMVCALALTVDPTAVQVYAVDLGGGSLHALAGLPHVGAIASRTEPELVRRTVATVRALITEREQRFRRLGIASIAEYRDRRAAGEHADDPYGDVFLVIDGWEAFRGAFDDLEPIVTAIAGEGLSFGVHLVLTAQRWADIRPSLKDALGTRIELRLGEPAESEIDRRAAARVPLARPGRGLTAGGHAALSALPRIDGSSRTDDLSAATAALVSRVGAAWGRPVAPPVRLLPSLVPSADLPAPDGSRAVPIGLGGPSLGPVLLDLGAEPHFLMFADAEAGKTSFLTLLAGGITARHTPDEARILLVDYRRTMLGAVAAEHLAGYASAAPALQTLVDELRAVLAGRLPGVDVTAEQLRTRSWWSGPEVFVLVDDYDLVAAPGTNPLAGLVEFLPQAKDVGLHVVLCRRAGGAARAMFDPVLQRLRELNAPGFVGSGSRDEGPLLGGVRPGDLPPGRGTLVSRRSGEQVVQLALPPPAGC